MQIINFFIFVSAVCAIKPDTSDASYQHIGVTGDGLSDTATVATEESVSVELVAPAAVVITAPRNQNPMFRGMSEEEETRLAIGITVVVIGDCIAAGVLCGLYGGR